MTETAQITGPVGPYEFPLSASATPPQMTAHITSLGILGSQSAQMLSGSVLDPAGWHALVDLFSSRFRTTIYSSVVGRTPLFGASTWISEPLDSERWRGEIEFDIANKAPLEDYNTWRVVDAQIVLDEHLPLPSAETADDETWW